MVISRWIICVLTLAAASVLASGSVLAATLDRNYRMGDAAGEGAANGGPVFTTFDSAGVGVVQLVDLTGINTPTYRTIPVRPDGGTGLGIEFNAAQMEYLHGPSLGFPQISFSSIENSGDLDYTGIADRGLQFWVRPASTAVQSLVMDTNQHGVRIDSSGRFSMRYAGVHYPSSEPDTVLPNTWYHVEVVRPAGAAGGSRMYVNGEAVAAAPDGYDDDTAHLVVGSNTGGDESIFTGGTAEFFSGIVDDLEMFVIGTTTSNPPINYGGFNLAVDNDYIASPVVGISGVAGDLNRSGSLTQADKDLFIAGWMDRKVVNGVQLGDLTTYGQGDLNFDGITNIQDLLVMQNAIISAGLEAITAAELQGVPEPSTVVFAVFAAVTAVVLGRAPRRRGR
jgi:hypothetical protein